MNVYESGKSGPYKSILMSPLIAVVGLALLAIGLVWWFHHQHSVEAGKEAALGSLLDVVAKDVQNESKAFNDAHLQIKEATVDVDLSDELKDTIETKNGVSEHKVDATTEGKGSSGHKLIIVLERQPDKPEQGNPEAPRADQKAPRRNTVPSPQGKAS